MGEKLCILTQSLQIYQIDKIFIDLNPCDCTIVGFQDSVLLISPDRTLTHWQVMGVNKCKKTVYAISEALDCLSDLNQVFATLNRIPFLVNNDNQLRIRRLSSYFLTPFKQNLADFVYRDEECKSSNGVFGDVEEDQTDFVKLHMTGEMSDSEDSKGSGNYFNIETGSYGSSHVTSDKDFEVNLVVSLRAFLLLLRVLREILI